jgi:orotidine-5'-phosphate decarboxylase
VLTKFLTKRMSKGMKIVSPGIRAIEFDCKNKKFIDMDFVLEAEEQPVDHDN